MNLDDREKYLVATAIFEWMKTEKTKPENIQRCSDMNDLNEILDKQLTKEKGLIQAVEEARICY